MTRTRPPIAVTALLLLFTGCTFADTTLWPTLSGDDPRGRMPSAALPTTTLLAQKPRSEQPDPGTELRRLQDNLRQRQEAFRRITDGFADSDRALEEALATARRSPAGDPARGAAAGRAETQLARSNDGLSLLAALSSATASDSALALYVAQASRAAAAQPGTDEAERARLARIERDAASAGSHADRLVAEIGGMLAERSRQLAAQRRDVAGAVASAASPARTAEAEGARASTPAARRPLVTIRFDRPDMNYTKDLRFAVTTALKRRPDAAFDIVAVAPAGTPPAEASAAAKRNMEGVVRAMSGMGVPADRLRLSATAQPGLASDEVRVFVR